MTNKRTKIKKTISSLAVPSERDLAVWQSMTLKEREAVLRARADEAAASPRRSLTADEIIAEAKSELANG